MILLTFNILNNHPATTSGTSLSEDQLLEITVSNTKALLRILEQHNIKSTFFVDVKLVEGLAPLLRKMVMIGHEVALYNQGADRNSVEHAKAFVSSITEKTVRGIRRKTVRLTDKELQEMGFIYVSDIENASILFPFKRLERSTDIIEKDGLSIIPESISPYSQIPYNDFVFQAVPMQYYKSMVTESLKNEEFVLIYLNTWQFTNQKVHGLKVPFYRRFQSGKEMEDKLDNFLAWVNQHDYATSRIKDYIF